MYNFQVSGGLAYDTPCLLRAKGTTTRDQNGELSIITWITATRAVIQDYDIYLRSRGSTESTTCQPSIQQSCYYVPARWPSSRIYLLPTRSSMNWFTKLTRNILIAPKITQIAVLYRPPYASLISSACRAIAEDYGMPRQTIKKIVSEYNDMCVDTSYATDTDDQLQKMNAIELGELERVLGGGIQRLTSLCFVSLRSDLDLPTGSSHCLNLPQFLRQGLVNRDGGKFGLIQNLTVAEYASYEILRCLHTIQLGHGSPTWCAGSLHELVNRFLAPSTQVLQPSKKGTESHTTLRF